MEFTELVKLAGVFIVIIGFALKLDATLIIMAAAVITAFAGGLGVERMLATLGSSFVANRVMAIFILIMLVIGTLERNGLKESAAKLIAGAKNLSPGMVIGVYGILRSAFAAFHVSFGGVAGFVRPVVLPMIEGSIEASGSSPNKDHIETLKGMSSGMENIAWFFCQVLFIGSGGGLLVQSTLRDLGIEVDLLELAIVEIPVAVFAVALTIVVYFVKDRKMMRKFYSRKSKEGNNNV